MYLTGLLLREGKGMGGEGKERGKKGKEWGEEVEGGILPTLPYPKILAWRTLQLQHRITIIIGTADKIT